MTLNSTKEIICLAYALSERWLITRNMDCIQAMKKLPGEEDLKGFEWLHHHPFEKK